MASRLPPCGEVSDSKKRSASQWHGEMEHRSLKSNVGVEFLQNCPWQRWQQVGRCHHQNAPKLPKFQDTSGQSLRKNRSYSSASRSGSQRLASVRASARWRASNLESSQSLSIAATQGITSRSVGIAWLPGSSRRSGSANTKPASPTASAQTAAVAGHHRNSIRQCPARQPGCILDQGWHQHDPADPVELCGSGVFAIWCTRPAGVESRFGPSAPAVRFVTLD